LPQRQEATKDLSFFVASCLCGIFYNWFNILEISSNFGVKMISILLFLALPSAEELLASGAYSLLPAAVKFC
jgi:hypothetical protein